ncbi:MAG: OmpA family protein [Candidatus Thiodiazotropha sp. (ex Lucina aurantia)]|nr:OmpA family protein [Candidatus Thiodiazotropha endolucinida]MBT3015066.1 OmpA family protein [Candidatus Thiodiazotropha taylori]MBV2098935.1 OmpA family protein [Candidatus Thiodiazotropha sp. (ex Codakia orbicularis)]MBV2102976.1 OmpA family protein [Candidatus Thiodiazotropha sp. (ex Lucina aurantia)]MBT3023199.1 OmpA family protein [Candidatus Thiodiazotropha taylori]MBV2117546.1 OmpA family protein [Candidatus Thiodiazotropha sp. (ex Lucina aurantia)]
MNEDRVNDLFDLAPVGFAAAQSKLAEAIVLGQKRNDAGVAEKVAEVDQLLDKAESDATRSKRLMREVLEARQLAIAAGADTMLKERFELLDEKLRKASTLVEKGDIEDAKKWRPEMLQGYSDVELDALKQDATENARQDIAQATESEADEYSPKTLKRALEELALSVAVLETNRTQREKAKNHALQASRLARRSVEITEMIKDFKRREYTMEEIILWYQKQISLISEPTGDELHFDQPNHEVVTALRNKLVNYTEIQQAELATRMDLQSRLEAVERENREAQARFDKIQDLFSSYEANVYRQGHNVLLELRAFNFPSGGSDIQSENFALLDKIVTAVKSFPNPDVVVSGHTDSVGGADVNQQLSQRRAETVASFLEKVGGVARNHITAIGYGESRPVANNETERGRKSNRRIEVLIINE